MSACETQGGAVMAPPIAKTGTAMPEQAPVSYQVFFPLGSSMLGDQDKTALAAAAQVYKTKPNARVTVTGFTDTVGSPALNAQLSQARANAVKNILVQNGVPDGSITTSGNGENDPLVPTADQTNESRNRRVVVVIQ
ncbi:MAG TPA: OmpA family protein [Reyranella sp.]|nr:OmpA family protein [Reyranella sp.]